MTGLLSFYVYKLIALPLHGREWRNKHINIHQICHSYLFPFFQNISMRLKSRFHPDNISVSSIAFQVEFSP